MSCILRGNHANVNKHQAMDYRGVVLEDNDHIDDRPFLPATYLTNDD